MTPDDFAKLLRQEIFLSGAKFKVFTNAKQEEEGLLVKRYGKDFKLIFLSEAGVPKRIPLELRDIISLFVPKLFPGVKTGPILPAHIEYGRSGETLRRAQTMRSILTSVLESTPLRTANRINNLKIYPPVLNPATLRETLLRDAPRIEMVECLDPGGSGFPRHPILADLPKISVADPKGIPKIITFVRMHPDPPTRTIILSEAPVGNAGQRADAISLSYKLSAKEIDHVKKGINFEATPAADKVAADPYLHVGDTNRPLYGVESENHVSKSIDYASLAIIDIINLTKRFKLTLVGRFIVTITDARQFSPALIVDQEGSIKTTRDMEDLTSPSAKSPTAVQPGQPDGVMKSLHITVEAPITNGSVTLKASTGVATFNRGKIPPEIMTLENLQKIMPKEVPGAIARLFKTIKGI